MEQQMAHWMSGYTEATQPLCDEPVFAAMTFQGAGGFASGVSRGLLGGWGRGGDKRRLENRLGGLPDMVIVAIGATKVFVFAYKTAGRKFALEPPVRAWRRDDLEVSSDTKRVASKLTIDVKSSGDHHELESTSMTGSLGKMTVEMFRLLADPQAS